MKNNFHRFSFLAVLVIIISACSPSTLIDNTEIVSELPQESTKKTFIAETSGPANFQANIFSNEVITFSWEQEPEALGYILQLIMDNDEPLPIAFLPPGTTQYSEFMAPEDSLLTYRLQTIIQQGTGGASSLQISTPSHQGNPFAVKAGFSTEGIIQKAIGPEGGSIETTDDKGVMYLLEIPALSLQTELEITMTPISTIDGWPLDGSYLGAIQIEPEGWLLNEVAFLTISYPATQQMNLSTIGFSFYGDGDEFHLRTAYIDYSNPLGLQTTRNHSSKLAYQQTNRVVRLPVMELKTLGVGEASSSSASAFAGEFSPTSNENAQDQKLAMSGVIEDELAPLTGLNELGQIATSNLLREIKNSKDCYEFKKAVASFQAWEGKVTQTDGGRYTNYTGDRLIILEDLAEKALQTIEESNNECSEANDGVVPGSVPCAEKLIRDIQSGSNSFFAELQSTMKKMPGMLDRLTDASFESQVCAHSFRVNEAASLGYQWTSSCIPSLDRPYQLAYIGPDLSSVFRFYPTGPFSGRMEGDSKWSYPEITNEISYSGTYSIEITKKDSKGSPLEMDSVLTMDQIIKTCIVDSECVTSTTTDDLLIPLLVSQKRCSVP